MYTQRHFLSIADEIAAMPVHSVSLRDKVKTITEWHVAYFSKLCPKFKPELFYNVAMANAEKATSDA